MHVPSAPRNEHGPFQTRCHPQRHHSSTRGARAYRHRVSPRESLEAGRVVAISQWLGIVLASCDAHDLRVLEEEVIRGADVCT